MKAKKKHGWNKRAQDQGFLSDPDIGVSCSRIEKELESIERSLESAIAISPEHAVDRIEQLRWMRQGHIVQTKEKESVLVGLREEQKEADAWKSMITRDINDIFTQHPTRDDQKKRANSVGQSSDVFTSLDELRIDLQKNDKVNTAVYDYHVRRSFAIVTMVLGNSKITSELEAQKHLKSIGLQREESSTGANNILAGIVDHATKDTPEQSIFAEQQGTEDIEPELMEFDTPDAQQSMQNIVNTVLETRRRINRAVDSILESNFVNEGLCASAGLPRQLCIRRDTLEHYLDSFEHGSTHENRQLLTRVQTEVYKLEYAATLISNIPLLQIDRFEAIGNMQNVNGYYDQSPDRIGIRNDMSPTEYERVLVHERGHAAFHYLTRKAEVFPFFLEAKYQQLHEKNSSIDTLLDSLAEEYGLLDEWDDMLKQAHGDETLARQVLRERILEEAYAQKEEYKNGENDTGPSSQSLELFRALNALEEDDEPEPQSEHLFRVSPDVQIRNNITTKMYNRRTISDEDQQDQGETAEVEGAHPVEKTLKEIQARVEKMRIFAQSNQKHANELAPYIEAFQKNHDDLFGVFSTQMLDGKPYPKPEDRVEFWNAVKSVDENTKNVMDSINKYDADTRDVNRIKPESRNLKDILWKEITWMSPLDIWLMFKDASEDIKRMWERKSALNRSEVGSKLFEIFPNVSHNFLGLGYLGRLSDEFERRQEEKENEEVDVWKKGLDSKDPFVLNEMLTNMTNKDQAKAILSLLAEKGRIEWSNEELWKTLNFLSSYKMPFDECRRDSLLRDNWLRKLISEIWGDKDLYNEWRRTNDDKFQSGKKQYENLTDTLAQHSPAMASELERQLRIFTDSKKNNETPPEDVNPHIYEEILEYAMTKGKMNMEQKFYYLIQGVAVGLLPLERLEIINPIVLQNFPFIDYFSSQNNTIPEVMAIAAKIKEPGSFEPGPRTQLFLQFEMARNESTRQRVLKVIRSGDSIDHEDIPMLMAFLDYGGINEMTTTFSGNRQRMTKEGAKNGYVGFNTVFKSYGMKALLDKNNQGKGIESVRFTKADANVLARSLAAYVQYDNLVTGQTGAVGGARQTLTWEQINQETMPSGGDKNVRDFRNPMNNFVAAAVKKLEINEIETKGGKISVDEYIGGTDDAYRTKIGSNGIARGRGSDRKSKNNDEEIFNATNNFVKQLADKIYENQDEFRNLLAQYASASAEQGGLINEGSKQLSPDIVSSSLQRSSVEKELKEGRISGYQDFAGIMAAQAA